MWRELSAPKRQSTSTLAMTDSLINVHIIPVLGSARIEELTVDDVEAFMNARVIDLSKSTLGKLRSIIAKSYDFGIRREYTQRNPARIAEMPLDARVTREGRALTADEVRQLLKIAEDHRLGAWVVVALTLGLRPGEVSGLTWGAIDYGRYTVTVYQSLGVVDGQPALKRTKTGGVRTLQIPDLAATALTKHRSLYNAEKQLAGDWPEEWSELVFVSSYGTPLDRTGTRKMIQRMAADAMLTAGDLSMTGDVLYLDGDVNVDTARFNDPVVLGSDILIEGEDAGEEARSVHFASTVDSAAGRHHDLEIDARDTLFDGHVGVGNRLGVPPFDIDQPGQGPYDLQQEPSISCLSGPWLKPLALKDVYMIRSAVVANKLEEQLGRRCYIVGYGGMKSWRDFVQMSLMGADLIGICTETMLRGYDYLAYELTRLKEWMKENDLARLEQVA